jgi:hypothetical protein
MEVTVSTGTKPPIELGKKFVERAIEAAEDKALAQGIVYERIIHVPSGKLAVVFKPGGLPRINPNDTRFELDFGGVRLACQINAKAARKLQTWEGGAVLQGRLVTQSNHLVLIEAGFQFLEPRPVEPQKPDQP